MKTFIAGLLAIPLGCCVGQWAFNYAGDASTSNGEVGVHKPPYTSPAPAYDVAGLNDLVARIEKPKSFVERQAAALASVYGLGGEDDGRPLEVLK